MNIKNPELRRFLKDKISVFALFVLIVLYVAIFFADFLQYMIKIIQNVLFLIRLHPMFILLMNLAILQNRILITGKGSLTKIL